MMTTTVQERNNARVAVSSKWGGSDKIAR